MLIVKDFSNLEKYGFEKTYDDSRGDAYSTWALYSDSHKEDSDMSFIINPWGENNTPLGHIIANTYYDGCTHEEYELSTELDVIYQMVKDGIVELVDEGA